MIIKEHKIVHSDGGDRHQHVIVQWFDREWRIMINDNYIQQITTAHLWENNVWRPFDGRDLNEAVVYDWIKNGKIVKVKYKVQ